MHSFSVHRLSAHKGTEYLNNGLDSSGAGVLFSFTWLWKTLGEAHSYGWRVTARCAAGKQEAMKRHWERVYRAELDMETLV